MEFYQLQKAAHLQDLKKLSRRYNIISASRLLMAVAIVVLGYFAFTAEDPTVLLCCIAFCFIEFILLMKRHGLVQNKRLRAEALVKINEDEMDYLGGKSIPFENGAEFIDYKHPYSHDLDIFGNRSLYHNLNRTQTFKGNEKLATLLTDVLPQEDITSNQEAVKELAEKPEFRQEIMALGKARKDNASVYSRLLIWANTGSVKLSAFRGIIAIIVPVLFTGSIATYLITGDGLFTTIAGWLFGFNLVFIGFHLKRVKAEMKDTTEIHDIIHHYGLIIEQIEKQSFASDKLKAVQAQLITEGKTASYHIKQLAKLFSRLDSSNNVFGAAVMNGVSLYHFHVLKSLLKWKKDHSQSIALWLGVIAEVEALSSFANLYYNNPDFTFPILNNDNKIIFTNLAHPLLKKEGRVGNDIKFDSDFVILTGSNMSGKSTFLRSLGINMVLAGAGAPVCADSAEVHPLPVLVSMRLSDSLSDSESYFFAEVKRLRFIMDELQEKRAFVMLDEILRGTNSDDKRTGTIKVIKRMISLNAIGAIATHDIEVCALSEEYPSKLVNRCFEAQIEDNELYFDYKLRDGICKNKSATFLMEKMGVV